MSELKSKAAIDIGKLLGIIAAVFYVIHFLKLIVHHREQSKAKAR